MIGRRFIVSSILVLGLVGCGSSSTSTNAPKPGTSTSASAAMSAAVPVPSASASAVASIDPDNEPPSTGKEMPKGAPPPTEDESTQIWNDVVATAKKPVAIKCGEIITAKSRLAFQKFKKDNAAIHADVQAYLRIARCAETRESYFFLIELGTAMKNAGDHPEYLARGYLGRRMYKLALDTLNAAAKSKPDDANVAMTFAKLYCTTAKYDDCKTYAESALSLMENEKEQREHDRIKGGANKYLARALTHMMKLDDASAALDLAQQFKAKQSDIDDIRGEIATARNNATIVDVDTAPEMLLGTYHLIGKLPQITPIAHVHVQNMSDQDVQYRVSIEISGVTQTAKQTITVPKQAGKDLDLDPALDGKFDIDSIRATQPSAISVKVVKVVKGGDETVVENSVPVVIQPRDYLPLATYLDPEHLMSIKDGRFVAAWVTPNDPAVETFITEAKKNLKKGSFSGKQRDSMPQVEAIFDTLRARGVSYVMDPESLSKDVFSQRTRLPAEVLSTTNAQCLEGAILYATMLETIGLEPVIFLVPGHAFVGWKPSPKDNSKEKYFFLETTMTGSKAPFKDVVDYATKEFADHDKKHEVRIVDIATLRKEGVLPQPSVKKL